MRCRSLERYLGISINFQTSDIGLRVFIFLEVFLKLLNGLQFINASVNLTTPHNQRDTHSPIRQNLPILDIFIKSFTNSGQTVPEFGFF